MKSRDVRFDTLKGIMIFLVVFTHCMNRLAPGYSQNMAARIVMFCIYSFHMPVFVFTAGYFCRPYAKKQYEGNCIAGCLLPYLFFNTAIQLMFGESVNPVKPTWVLWFMLSLFCWRIGLKAVLSIRFSFVWSVLFAVAVGFTKAGTDFSFSRTVCFLPFFLAGYFYRSGGRKYLPDLPKKVLVPAFLAVQGAAAALAVKNISLYSFMMNYSYQKMKQTAVSGPLIRLLVIVLGFLAVMFFLKTASGRINVFSRLGQYSLTVYLGHSVIIRLLRQAGLVISPDRTLLVLAVSFGLAAVLCLAFGNRYADSFYRKCSGLAAKLFLTEKNAEG